MSAPQEYVEVFKPTSGRFLGVVGLLVCAGVVAVVLFVAWRWLKTGYRMKP